MLYMLQSLTNLFQKYAHSLTHAKLGTLLNLQTQADYSLKPIDL